MDDVTHILLHQKKCLTLACASLSSGFSAYFMTAYELI